jgi:thiol-disulfide isomerase/thioredoxin
VRRSFRPTSSSWVVGILTLALVGLNACSSGSDSSSVAQVPFTAADGTSTNAAAFRGTPLVLNMWATNCKPCVKEMPAFDEVAAEQAGTVAVIGVNVFDDAETAAEFATDLGVTYPQYNDPNGELSTALEVTGLPATAFFAADGTLIDVHQGAYTADELRLAIDTLLLQADEGTEGS